LCCGKRAKQSGAKHRQTENMEFQPQPGCLLEITSSKLMKKLKLESFDFSLFWCGVPLEALLRKPPHDQNHVDAF